MIGALGLLAWSTIRSPQSRYLQAMLWLAPVIVAPYLIIYDMLLIILPISFLAPLLRKDRLLQAGVASGLAGSFAGAFHSQYPPADLGNSPAVSGLRLASPETAGTSAHPGVESHQDQVGQQQQPGIGQQSDQDITPGVEGEIRG